MTHVSTSAISSSLLSYQHKSRLEEARRIGKHIPPGSFSGQEATVRAEHTYRIRNPV
jgi:hypothetical protein